MRNIITVHDRGRMIAISIDHICAILERDIGNYKSCIFLSNGETIMCTETTGSLALMLDSKLTATYGTNS